MITGWRDCLCSAAGDVVRPRDVCFLQPSPPSLSTTSSHLYYFCDRCSSLLRSRDTTPTSPSFPPSPRRHKVYSALQCNCGRRDGHKLYICSERTDSSRSMRGRKYSRTVIDCSRALCVLSLPLSAKHRRAQIDLEKTPCAVGPLVADHPSYPGSISCTVGGCSARETVDPLQ